MIDNYDSFTYNLVQYFGELGESVSVFRNDHISLNDIHAMSPSYIVISPGPCTPNQAGVSIDIVNEFAHSTPILGVCLGHQCIAQALGGKIIRAGQLMHGKTSLIEHQGGGIFTNIPTPFQATRYHSLVVDESSLPSCFSVTARAEDGEVMGLTHNSFPLVGVQFHPESILTQYGHNILSNFLSLGAKQ